MTTVANAKALVVAMLIAAIVAVAAVSAAVDSQPVTRDAVGDLDW